MMPLYPQSTIVHKLAFYVIPLINFASTSSVYVDMWLILLIPLTSL